MVKNNGVEQIEQIAACPFCGGGAAIDECGAEKFFVYCTNDECFVQPETGWFKSASDAVAKWNTRAVAGTIAELTEALTDAREAIASLDTEALGMVVVAFGDPERDVYPVRDELLAKADAALAPPRHD